MRSRFVTAIGLAALAAAVVTVPAEASAATTPAPAGSVVFGTISTSSGAPLPGATVVLYAWPSQSVTASIKIGQVVPRTLVGQTVSSSTGSYSITPSNVAGLASSASASGIVNLEVDAMFQGHENAFFFPRHLVPSGPGMALAVASEAPIPQMSAQAADLTIYGVQAAASATPQAAAAPDIVCVGNTPIATWNNVGVNLGGEWSHLDSVTMKFTYSTGSSSTLGSGVEAAGVIGFSAGGTYTVGAGSSQNWQPENVSSGYNRKSNFTYTEYEDSCGNREAHVTSWDGGNSTTKVGFLPASMCEVEYATPGEPTVTLDNTKAWTYSSGVSIAGIIGINLSAETGYNQDASESYWFTDTAHTRYLCGRNGFPLATNPAPGYVVAGASSSGGS
jgi:hypothetical protein